MSQMMMMMMMMMMIVVVCTAQHMLYDLFVVVLVRHDVW